MIWSAVAKYVAIGAAILFIIQMIRTDGAQSLQNKIERQNNDASENAEIARLGYDDCIDAGRVWNFGTGRCERTP